MEFKKGEVDRESQRSGDVALQPPLPVPLPIQQTSNTFSSTSKIHIKGQTRITKTNLKKQKRKFSPIISKPLTFIMIKIMALVQGKDHHKYIKQIKKSET